MRAGVIPTRILTLDVYNDPPSRSQTESFQRVQAGMKRKHPEQYALLERVCLRLATQPGKGCFTAEEVLDEAGGRANFPKNLIGAVIGNLRSKHAICVVNRVKSKHHAAKGRWVSVFSVNAEAIRIAE